MIDDLIKSTRSFRRFDSNVSVERRTLEDLIDLARHSASARNLQPLKYIPVCDPETNHMVFETLTWAKDLNDWSGPSAEERPTAYIVVLGDTRITSNFGCDHGIASQNIMLGARERGLGGCIMASVDRQKLRERLKIPEYLEILLVLAIGKPNEKVIIEPLPSDGSVAYWRDNQGHHHVPKRSLSEIIVTGYGARNEGC